VVLTHAETGVKMAEVGTNIGVHGEGATSPLVRLPRRLERCRGTSRNGHIYAVRLAHPPLSAPGSVSPTCRILHFGEPTPRGGREPAPPEPGGLKNRLDHRDREIEPARRATASLTSGPPPILLQHSGKDPVAGTLLGGTA
jgi:hypothetical protein